MAQGDKVNNPDKWEKFKTASGRIGYRLRRSDSESSVGGDADAARSDFLVEEVPERTLEDITDGIQSVLDEVDTDPWGGGSDIWGEFDKSEEFSLMDGNDEMVAGNMRLIVKDDSTGDLYSCHAYSAWGSPDILSIERVKEVTKVVKKVSTTQLEDSSVIHDPELADSFLDYVHQVEKQGGNDVWWEAPGVLNLAVFPGISYYPSEDTGVERKKFYRLTPPQEESPEDVPDDYEMDFILSHNDQAYNGREYETGMVYIDEKLGRGFVIIGDDSSENGGSVDILRLRNGSIEVNISDDDYVAYGTLTNSLKPLTVTDETVERSWYTRYW